jgi:hypothetical protein
MSKCNICEKTFKCPSALKTHQNRKTPCSKDEVINNKPKPKPVTPPKKPEEQKIPPTDGVPTNVTENTNTYVRNCTINTNINNSLNANIILTPIDFEYFNSIEEANSAEPKYGMKYSNSTLSTCSEADIQFLKDLIAQPDFDCVVDQFTDFLLEHCEGANSKDPLYWKDEKSILVKTVKILMGTATTWNRYIFEDSVRHIIVHTFFELINQFMYSYMVDYVYQVMDAEILNQQLNIILRIMNKKKELIDAINENIKTKIIPDGEFQNDEQIGQTVQTEQNEESEENE